LGTEPDAFGLLQIPPLDLERVEVIKGAGSALYGTSSLGGVLNLVSRPSTADSTVMANASSRGGEDLEAFLTSQFSTHWSGSVMGGAHYQSREDVNGDGWTDIAGYRRFTIRPRIYWRDSDGDTTFITLGIVDEDRTGGTLPGRTIPDGTSFPVELQTHRYDGGVVSQWALSGDRTFTFRASATSSHLDETFGLLRTPWTQDTEFTEASLNGTSGRHGWVVGLAFNRDQLSVPTQIGVGHVYNVPAVFAQDDYVLTPWVTLAGSARVDANDSYGTFLSPRLSALLRNPDSSWSFRASVAGGFTAPTPFIDEVEETGLGSVLPLTNVHAERAVTESLDAKWSAEGWQVDASVFSSDIHDPLMVLPVGAEKFEIINAPGARHAPGAETLIGYGVGAFHFTASYTYIHATQEDTPDVREDASLVPRQAADIGAIIESEKRGRIGFEVGYTGKQAVEEDSYRHEAPGYFEFNMLGELRFGETGIFLNAMNLTNVRQTNYNPLLRPSLGPGGNPITDVWAPLAGRTFNLGIRAELE
jgi:outer membrane receptor for ferrienterochelin and colicins